MAEAGVDISGQQSKNVKDLLMRKNNSTAAGVCGQGRFSLAHYAAMSYVRTVPFVDTVWSFFPS